MNTKRIATAISFMVIMFVVAACDTGQSMMHGDNSMGMDNWGWNWPLAIGSLLVGILIGFLIGRRKR